MPKFPDDDDIQTWYDYLNKLGSIKETKALEEQCDYAELDLHGKTVEESFHLVIKFIKFLSSNNINKAKIITGLGSDSHKEYGQLYYEVPDWLSHPEIKDKVKSFERKRGALIVKMKQ